ncbi:hypothetical protein [Aureliella helgolandensis]|uniref:Uncharacterized protein n=1 Tax=Aureliella helgolandensis TaxID=2527968 RepID=A0A518FZH2_9BACT|nr:hypothetical protein [Aureliella helgolandensis]QDV21757.1 hypothetical protein Q31a_00360 [Aureliella helgolandensis]
MPLINVFAGQAFCLIAEGRVAALRAGFQMQETKSLTIGLVLIAASFTVILATALLYWFIQRRAAKRFCSPKKLFRELCRVHHFSFPQRRLLAQLVKVGGVSDPNLLFIDSRLWILDPSKNPKLCVARNRRHLQKMQRAIYERSAEAE